MVPPAMQREVWSVYRPGQEIDKRPSAAYIEVQRRVVLYVAQLEGLTPGPSAAMLLPGLVR